MGRQQNFYLDGLMTKYTDLPQDSMFNADSIVDTVREPLLVLSADLRVRKANRSFYRTFKVTPQETAGQLIYELGNHQWDIPWLRKLLEEVLPKDMAFDDFEVDHVFPVIGRKFMLLNARRICRKDNQTEFILLAIEDTTERRKAEEALREADRHKDEFLAMLSHELRTPLGPVLNGLQILKQLGREDTVVENVRTIMERQVQHLTRLVDDLLDVARITHGKLQLRKDLVNLAALVSEAVEISRPLVEGRHHELTVSLPPKPIHLEADPTRLTQILTNLLANAANSSETGGQMWLTAEREANDLMLRVRDTGRGIPAEMLTRIFEPFQQSDQGPGHSPGGLGIGLTLVRQLVELHGGTVEAFSAGSGQGSELVVRLPILSEHQQVDALQSKRGGIQPVVVSPNRRILVIDDNVDAAKSLAMLLRLEGHDVRVACSGPNAIEIARKEPPEIIIVDLGMPDMDGYAVAQQLRKWPALENVLLVAMTGYGQEQDRLRSQKAGFDRHLVKPVELKTLHELLAHAKG